jgi:hypothetical protein
MINWTINRPNHNKEKISSFNDGKFYIQFRGGAIYEYYFNEFEYKIFIGNLNTNYHKNFRNYRRMF